MVSIDMAEKGLTTLTDEIGKSRRTEVTMKGNESTLGVFVVADILCAILGADFLAAFNLPVDYRQSRLYDKTTNLSIREISSSDASRQLAGLDSEPESSFRQLLSKYAGITRPKLHHFYLTTGLCSPHPDHWPSRVFSVPPSGACRSCCRQGRLRAHASNGHHPSTESPCASPLHMVPEAATGDWQPCGDYRSIKNVTVTHRYAGPHLQDFVGALFGKSMLSKVDLVRAFHQMPIVPEDVSKTAVTTPFGLFEFLRMRADSAMPPRPSRGS
ncbi:hypothetical protein SprV_0200936000 [Sparganum proliferum]